MIEEVDQSNSLVLLFIFSVDISPSVVSSSVFVCICILSRFLVNSSSLTALLPPRSQPGWPLLEWCCSQRRTLPGLPGLPGRQPPSCDRPAGAPGALCASPRCLLSEPLLCQTLSLHPALG